MSRKLTERGKWFENRFGSTPAEAREVFLNSLDDEQWNDLRTEEKEDYALIGWQIASEVLGDGSNGYPGSAIVRLGQKMLEAIEAFRALSPEEQAEWGKIE